MRCLLSKSIGDNIPLLPQAYRAAITVAVAAIEVKIGLLLAELLAQVAKGHAASDSIAQNPVNGYASLQAVQFFKITTFALFRLQISDCHPTAAMNLPRR